jgi:hypothetical protein
MCDIRQQCLQDSLPKGALTHEHRLDLSYRMSYILDASCLPLWEDLPVLSEWLYRLYQLYLQQTLVHIPP